MRSRVRMALLAAVTAGGLVGGANLVAAEDPAAGESRGSRDSHAGYYYPPPDSREVFVARATPAPDASRATRVGFVTGLTQQQLAKPYPPPYAIFAKGDEAEKLIIVSLGDHGFRTLYQARGVLAQLTAVARSSTLLRELDVEDVFTFFDLARLLGFSQITVSNGETFAHQVLLQ